MRVGELVGHVVLQVVIGLGGSLDHHFLKELVASVAVAQHISCKLLGAIAAYEVALWSLALETGKDWRLSEFV